MGKKEMIRKNRACREKVEALIRRNKKQREEIVELYGENRAKITAAEPEGWSGKYARGWTDAQVLTVALVVAGCIVSVVVLNLVRG